MENEAQTVGIAPSPVMAPHLAHYKALKPLEHLEAEMSLALPKDGLDGALLGDLVASMSKGVKRFAMTEHESVFEIMRFPDGYDLNLFYKHDKFNKAIVEKLSTRDAQVLQMEKACELYLCASWEEIQVYCAGLPKAMHAAEIIPYAYLQRKLASVAIFRKDRNGATAALKSTIEKLVNAGFMREVPKQFCFRNFQTASKSFQFSRAGAFNEL